jgi:MarR family transcriptional regulator, lower aerobic nicotinate degradation pathway regulator
MRHERNDMNDVEKNRILWGRPGYLARRLHQINVAIFLAEFEDVKITPVQWGVLTVVAMTPGLGHTDISAQCGIDRVNVADVLIRLEEKGLIKQGRSPTDRRQRSAVATEYGLKLLEDLEPRVRRAHEILLSPLTDAEREVFLKLLRRIVEDNNELSRAPLDVTRATARKSKETADSFR